MMGDPVAKKIHGKLKTDDLPKVITGGCIDWDDERLADGFAYASGRVRLASGEVLPAVLELCICDACGKETDVVRFEGDGWKQFGERLCESCSQRRST